MIDSIWQGWSGLALMGLIGLIALLSIVIWSIRSHRDPRLRVQCDAPIEALMPSLAGLTLGTPVPGNAVEVLENGKPVNPINHPELKAMQLRGLDMDRFRKQVARSLEERTREGKVTSTGL